MIRSGSDAFQSIEQFPGGGERVANGAELSDGQQLAGGGDAENLRQVVDAGKVEGLGDESGGGGLVEEPLAVAACPTDGQAGVEGGGRAHGGGGERRELLAHGAPF